MKTCYVQKVRVAYDGETTELPHRMYPKSNDLPHRDSLAFRRAFDKFFPTTQTTRKTLPMCGSSFSTGDGKD